MITNILVIINIVLLLFIIYLIGNTRYINKRENDYIKYKLEHFEDKLTSFQSLIIKHICK